MERDELQGWLRLTLTPGIGTTAARRLLTAFGLPAAIFSQSSQALRRVVTAAQADALSQASDDLAAQLTRTSNWLAEGDGIRTVVTLGDALYPACLLDIEDPPVLLYVTGRLDWPHDPGRCLAIVGSRNPTPQGEINARQFARSLREAGLTIVSGLALGIDAAAHEGALDAPYKPHESPATIAVVGTGLDRVYPKAHHDLAHRIAGRGLLISEYPLGTPALAPNFPRRNRLIAGLSRGALVVEAALKSGSLITARLAAEQGKDVFAIPGSIHATQSRGCHELIRQGAKLVESAQDVLEEFSLLSPRSRPSPSAPVSDVTENQPLLQAMGLDPVSLDVLQAETGMDIATLQAQLMTLELEGHVARLPGGLLQRLIRA